MQPHHRLRRNYAKLQKAIDSGHPACAIILGYRLVERFPEFSSAWLLLGGMLYLVARYEEAERALLKALKLMAQEHRWVALQQLGQLFREAGDYARSAEWHRKQVDEFPRDASGYICLGAVLAKSGQLAEAEKVHRRGTQCETGAVDEAYLNLGLVLRALQRYAEAAECFREAIRLDPNYDAAKDALRDVELCLKLNAKPQD